jgi:AraC-like DNA-binding protein
MSKPIKGDLPINVVWRTEMPTPAHKLVAMWVAWFSYTDTHWSIDTIAQHIGVSRRYVSSIISDLVTTGVLMYSGKHRSGVRKYYIRGAEYKPIRTAKYVTQENVGVQR